MLNKGADDSEVPFGAHLIHESYEDAFAEASRLNKALDEIEVKATKGFVAKPWYVRNAENLNIDPEINSLNELCKQLAKNQHIDKYLEDNFKNNI